MTVHSYPTSGHNADIRREPPDGLQTVPDNIENNMNLEIKFSKEYFDEKFFTNILRLLVVDGS